MFTFIQKPLVAFILATSIFNSVEGSPLQDKKKAGMIQELEIIKHHFEVSYAPIEWKKEHANWDLDTVFELAKQQILNAPTITTKQFHKIVRDFVQSTQDYHVSVAFCSTEQAALPFTARGINGRYYIDWFDALLLPQSFFGISVGDELIEFDGKPIAEVMDALMTASGKQLNPRTEQSFAEIALTMRSGMRGDIVPKGTIIIKTRSSLTGKENTCQVRWSYTPEHVRNPMDFMEFIDFSSILSSDNSPKEQLKVPSLLMINPMHQQEAFTLGGHQRGLGSKKSFLPKLGKIVWEIQPEESIADLLLGGEGDTMDSDLEMAEMGHMSMSRKKNFSKNSGPKSSFWNAYIYKNGKGSLIGYVRIPHYNIDEEDVDKFGELMDWMEDRTDALVIDQLNNPGGQSNCLYRMASCLTSFPLATPKHQMKISQMDALQAHHMLELLDRIEKAFLELSRTIEEQGGLEEMDGEEFLFFKMFNFQELLHIKTYFEHILSEWNAGRSLTHPIHLISSDMVNPMPHGKYTKPVIMLINELDFSCADFMPAILQDNKRAVLFGMRTAGAGGCVKMYSIPSQHGIIGGSLTNSIAERLNKDKIENLGVKPDIDYEITAEDITGGYRGYVEAVNRAINAMIHN